MRIVALAYLVAVPTVALAIVRTVRRSRQQRAELKARARRWWNTQELAPLAEGVCDEDQVA